LATKAYFCRGRSHLLFCVYLLGRRDCWRIAGTPIRSVYVLHLN